jgi:hypothetical protein
VVVKSFFNWDQPWQEHSPAEKEQILQWGCVWSEGIDQHVPDRGNQTRAHWPQAPLPVWLLGHFVKKKKKKARNGQVLRPRSPLLRIYPRKGIEVGSIRHKVPHSYLQHHWKLFC